VLEPSVLVINDVGVVELLQHMHFSQHLDEPVMVIACRSAVVPTA
jgi:hypothetical protein